MLLLVGAVVVAAGLWIVIGNTRAASAERREDRQWGDVAESMTRFRSELQSDSTNASAVALSADAVGLGINMELKEAVPERQAAAADRKAFESIKDALNDYVLAQLRDGTDLSAVPPEPVAAYFRSQDARIEKLLDGVETREPPRWEFRPEGGIDAPLPNLLGQIELQKVLLGSALERLSRPAGAQDPAGVSRRLDASWKLNAALSSRPELISRLIELAGWRMHAGTLRKTAGDPETWSRRYRGVDLRDELVRSYQFDASQQTEWARRGLPGVMSDRSFVVTRLLRPILRPWYRFSMAEFSENWRRVAVKVRSVPLCTIDEADARAILSPMFSSWNTIGSALWADIPSAIDKVARLQLDRELTLRVLEAKAGEELTASNPSKACPEVSWVAEEKGPTITIRAEPPRPPWPSEPGLILPLSHQFPRTSLH